MWIINIDLEWILPLAYSNMKSKAVLQNNRFLESDVEILA
jgi:hypothetical protein